MHQLDYNSFLNTASEMAQDHFNVHFCSSTVLRHFTLTTVHFLTPSLLELLDVSHLAELTSPCQTQQDTIVYTSSINSDTPKALCQVRTGSSNIIIQQQYKLGNHSL